VSELQPQPILLLLTADKPKTVKETLVVIQKTRVFLICDDCFWCASALKSRLVEIDCCPQCQKQISSIPLADNEGYTYSYDKGHGVELDFWSSRKRQ
jgi:hypothetical protein